MQKDEEIRRSIEAFKHRRIYDSFDIATLASIPDDKLEQAVFDYVLLRIGEDYTRELETLTELSSGFRAIYTTIVVESEVDNGGFNQYFWNSQGRSAELAVTGFYEIGAPAFANLMGRAMVTWRQEYSLLRRLKVVGTLKAFGESYQHSKLGPLDQEFYELSNSSDLRQCRITYIRHKPLEFVTSSGFTQPSA